MKVTVPVLVALLSVSFAFAQGATSAVVTDYPLQLVTHQMSSHVTQDVVHVLLADGTKPDLDEFMRLVVPKALAANGALPAPANVETMVRDVAIPMAKRAFIYNQGALPLSLRVRANPNSATKATQDSHERFIGRTNDGWTFWSYFITQYTVVTPATKYRTKSTETFVHKGYKWVDP
jgi:hypothetical protein